jgi:hypothetical protein
MSIELKWGGTDDGKEQRRQRQSTRQDNLSVFVRSLMIAFCHITFASLAYGERADDYSEIELPSAR